MDLNMTVNLTSVIYFWSAWIIIPIVMEIIPGLVNFAYTFVDLLRREKKEPLEFLPHITVIIPVYNSAETLYRCIQSVDQSTYPNELIDVLLVDNGSTDNSYEEFERAQLDYPSLFIWSVNSNQGKSKALNKAIFNSEGKYIINIDSDGILEEQALMNIVYDFETQDDADCLTGIILTEPALIKDTDGFFLRQFQKVEFMEYASSFIVGKSFKSRSNEIYTISGAFSALRKSVLVKTFLYNTNTICEDTHLTFQIKQNLGKKVHLCEEAIFMVDPIEGFDKFYTQRQRWQIGELEVSNMFLKDKLDNPIYRFFSDHLVRLLIVDHTFAFPRMVWYFVLFAIGSMNQKFDDIIVATALIYLLYVIVCLLNYVNIVIYFNQFKNFNKYYARKVLYLILLPLYNMVAYLVRLAGIINSTKRKNSWKTFTLTEELKMIGRQIREHFNFIGAIRRGTKRLVEEG